MIRGQEDPLENGMVTQSNLLAWQILGQEGGALWATVHGVVKSWTGNRETNTLTL